MNLQCSDVSAGNTSAEMSVINHGSSVNLFFKSRPVADILNDVFRYLPSKSFQASAGVVPYQMVPRPGYCTSFLSLTAISIPRIIVLSPTEMASHSTKVSVN
jgi:hypothetical protein